MSERKSLKEIVASEAQIFAVFYKDGRRINVIAENEEALPDIHNIAFAANLEELKQVCSELEQVRELKVEDDGSNIALTKS